MFIIYTQSPHFTWKRHVRKHWASRNSQVKANVFTMLKYNQGHSFRRPFFRRSRRSNNSVFRSKCFFPILFNKWTRDENLIFKANGRWNVVLVSLSLPRLCERYIQTSCMEKLTTASVPNFKKNSFKRTDGTTNGSCKISLFPDAFRLTVVNFFGEFYNLTLNTCIYKP